MMRESKEDLQSSLRTDGALRSGTSEPWPMPNRRADARVRRLSVRARRRDEHAALKSEEAGKLQQAVEVATAGKTREEKLACEEEGRRLAAVVRRQTHRATRTLALATLRAQRVHEQLRRSRGARSFKRSAHAAIGDVLSRTRCSTVRAP